MPDEQNTDAVPLNADATPDAPLAPKRARPRGTFAPAAVDVEKRDDGTLILRSPVALGAYAQRVGDWLAHWADVEPDRPFLAERSATGQWQAHTYSEVASKSGKLAAGLVRRRLSADRPLVVLSENSVEHALLMLAAMQVGVPVAPLSPAYSLQSKDFAKLKAIVRLLQPGLVYAADDVRYGNALAAIRDLHDGEVVVGSPSRSASGASSASNASGDVTPIAALYVLGRTAEVALAADTVGPDMIAKFLFTSGSTGEPKAVINTHRMLTSNQQAKLQTWPFLGVASDPPVIVDWLPWSHTFGGNHNFNMVLANGGTLYIDGGRPLPGLFDRTIANLRDIATTIHFNVPRGYDMLIQALEADDALREHFFSRMKVLFYAGAALPQNLWDALNALSMKATGKPVPLVTSWGSTETAPLATDCHFQAPRSGVVGIPVPGTEVKLIPDDKVADMFEIRVRGPNVTPGYWKQPDVTASAFDDEGFYRIGDAVRFADKAHPQRGLVFDGRIAEDFKLATGTSVQAGSLRIRGVAALAPVAQDIVVTGHDCDACGFLVFPNIAACRALAGLGDDAGVDEVLGSPAVRDKVRAGLAALKDTGGGSSTFATRALLLSEPPSIDAGEITDKGYINQRAVRERRRALADVLDGRAPDTDPPRIIAL